MLGPIVVAWGSLYFVLVVDVGAMASSHSFGVGKGKMLDDAMWGDTRDPRGLR